MHKQIKVSGKSTDLERIIQGYPVGADLDSITRFSNVFLSIPKLFDHQLETLLIKTSERQKKLFGANSLKYREFLFELFRDNRLPLFNRASLMSAFLKD